MRISDWSSDVCSSDLGRSFDKLRTNGLKGQLSASPPLSKSRATFGSRSNLSIWLASSKLSSARNLSFAAYFIRTFAGQLFLRYAVLVLSALRTDDRQIVVSGKRVSERLDLGGR